MKKALERINSHAQAGVNLRQRFFADQGGNINAAALETALRIATGGKLLICGNGGSAADAQHIAGEFVNRFLVDRPALPAMALTTDTSVITAISNDFEYNKIFSRQIEAFGTEKDVLLAISTSGNSVNVLSAIGVAREKKLFVIGLTGRDGGKMATLCDILVNVPDNHTPLIQEMHLAAEHLLCELTDYYLFENPSEIAKRLRQTQ